jgi:hypothetical protein
MRRLERELVPEPRSACSTNTVRSPRIAASRAIPAPVMPPPMINTSTGLALNAPSAGRRKEWLAWP